ncbi:hypothetical protein SPICUR_06585 [Spiribacter curvatus]|uniref:High frequency lysogenization protein HflD homolog n=1 Tax=Spiribacter curvatus TaxID=1335757 RepID=U5T7S9_9GAMM|nr:high frequency lysogenization protein HflD [Spiribacter curvatus]AGY92282.1 hypothetical protein SPICUR_06585 [Spiribacter curvatus]
MASPEQERTEALGAVFQALGEVRSIAERGQHDATRTETCLRGLLGDYSGSVETLYGGPGALDTGLRDLVNHLSKPESMHLTRYMIGVLQLERRIRRDRHRLPAIAGGLERARSQADYFGRIDHDSVIHHLGDLYSEHISPLRPRILVQGHATYLQGTRNAALIRGLLLAAIRAAGIWQMNGGGRLRLVFGRRAIIESAEAILTAH